MPKAIFFENLRESFLPNMLKEMYIDGVYEPFFQDLKDATVIDLGANIGMFSMYAYDRSKKIYAVEPSKQHLVTLKKNMSFNKLDDKVVIIEKAVSLTDGKTELYNPNNATAKSINPAVKIISNSTDIVETIRMDTLFTQYNIEHVDFVKMDVEGVEMEIIGGEGFQNVADKIDAMVIEWHTWENRIPAQMITTLSDYGFKVWPIASGDVTLIGAKRI